MWTISSADIPLRGVQQNLCTPSFESTEQRNSRLFDQRGTMVVVSPYIVHRHRVLWRDPDVFDPARFLPGAQPGIRPYSFLPFGVGPRMCIGAGLAVHEATYVLAALASRFEWDLAPGQTIWPAQRNFTLRPLEGLHMRINSTLRAAVPDLNGRGR